MRGCHRLRNVESVALRGCRFFDVLTLALGTIHEQGLVEQNTEPNMHQQDDAWEPTANRKWGSGIDFEVIPDLLDFSVHDTQEDTVCCPTRNSYLLMALRISPDSLCVLTDLY